MLFFSQHYSDIKSLLVRHLLENCKLKLTSFQRDVLIYIYQCMGVCLMPDFYETTTAVVKYAEVRKENEEKVKTKMFN